MLKQIRVTNLRGISSLSIGDFKRINLLVGRNNCGKTTLLEGLFLASTPANPTVIAAINNSRNIILSDENDWTLIFNRLDAKHSISLVAEFTGPDEIRSIEISPRKQLGTIQVTSQPGMIGDNADTTTGGLELNFSISSIGPNATKRTYHSEVFFSNARLPGSQAPIVSATPPENYLEKLKVVFLTSTSMSGQINTRFSVLQKQKRIPQVISALKRIEPNLTALSLGSDNLIYADIGLDKLIPINMMGDGMGRLLSIVLAISQCENGILLIDEVETGFHYSAQNILWEAISEFAKEFNTQIIATTHSMECVRAFSELGASTAGKKDIKLFRLERSDSQYNAIGLDSNELTTALKSEWEVR